MKINFTKSQSEQVLKIVADLPVKAMISILAMELDDDSPTLTNLRNLNEILEKANTAKIKEKEQTIN